MYYIFSSLINFIASLGVAIFVFIKNRRNKLNRSFILFSLSISWWAFGYTIWQLSKTASTALFWIRFAMMGSIIIPPAFTEFILRLIQKEKKYYLLRYINWTIGIGLMFFSYSPWFIQNLFTILEFTYWPKPGILFFIFHLYFVLNIVSACLLMYSTYRSTDGIVKIKVGYVLLASFIGFIGGMTNHFLWYRIPIPPFGNIGVGFGILITSYAIIKYSLLDIKIAVTRFGIFIMVYTLVLGIPFGLAGLGKGLLMKYFGDGWFWVPMSILLGFATLGPYVYMGIQSRVEKRLRRDELHEQEKLRNLSGKMVRILNPRILLGITVRQLVRSLKVSSASIYLQDEGGGSYSLKASYGRPSTPSLPDKIDNRWSILQEIILKKQALIQDELKLPNYESSISPEILQKELNNLRASYIIPSFLRESCFGILILGQRINRPPLTRFGITNLTLLSNQAALAIENAFLHQREINWIAEQSRRQALADMAPGASHQFNNRLSTIVNTIDNAIDLFENFSQQLSKQQLIQQILQVLKQISSETMKGKQITQAILQRSKVRLEFSKVDIVKLITNAITLIKIRRTKASLGGVPEPEIIFVWQKGLPLIIICEGPIQDVIENILNNAIDAIVIKTIRIKENRLKSPSDYKGRILIDLKRQDRFILIQIEDNGIGIKKEDIPKIFVPYYTTKATAEKGISGGYGLGLWVMRDFVERHGGTIKVESEYTKWTRFTIKLPIDFNPNQKRGV